MIEFYWIFCGVNKSTGTRKSKLQSNANDDMYDDCSPNETNVSVFWCRFVCVWVHSALVFYVNYVSVNQFGTHIHAHIHAVRVTYVSKKKKKKQGDRREKKKKCRWRRIDVTNDDDQRTISIPHSCSDLRKMMKIQLLRCRIELGKRYQTTKSIFVFFIDLGRPEMAQQIDI